MKHIYSQYFDMLWNQLRVTYREQMAQQEVELEALQAKLKLLKSNHQAIPAQLLELKTELVQKRQQLSQIEAEREQNHNQQQSQAIPDLEQIKQDCQRALKALQIERGLALLPEVKKIYNLSPEQDLRRFDLDLKQRSGEIQKKWVHFLKSILEKVEQLEQGQPQVRKRLKTEQERLQAAITQREALKKTCEEYGLSREVLTSLLNISSKHWQDAKKTLKAMKQDAEIEAALRFLSNQAYPPRE